MKPARSWILLTSLGLALAGLELTAAAAAAGQGAAAREQALARQEVSSGKGLSVFLVSNFHPASCGWLTDWSTERNYCANSYLSHLDRVRDDPSYAFALSEVNTILAMMEFVPERVTELKERIREGRVELVNAFFLEPTINLSGGEALAKQGIEGLRWQEAVFRVRPRNAWMIDVTGVHEQMGQIVPALGLDALVYTRDNPTPKTLHWLEAPDGSRVLAVSPGHYSEWGDVFNSQAPLGEEAIRRLVEDARGKAGRTAPGAPVLVLGGGGDYSLPPRLAEYPRRFIEDWKRAAPGSEIQFTTLSRYLDAVLPLIRSGQIELPVNRSGARLSWWSFWIECPRVKGWYRRCEHALQSAEALSTISSLESGAPYPAVPLQRAWLLMLLNMDRNTLWGAAGGMVFEHARSWDVRDRFEKVEAISAEATASALRAALGKGEKTGNEKENKVAVGLFNPLNWRRSDVLRLQLPPDSSLEGAACQESGGEEALCRVDLPPVGLAGLRLVPQPPARAAEIPVPQVIETAHYAARLDPASGALASLKLKPSGREVLAGPVLLVAEEAGDFHETPARPKRKRLADFGEPRSAGVVQEAHEFSRRQTCRGKRPEPRSLSGR